MALPSSTEVIDAFQDATQENLLCRCRKGQTTCLPESGELFMTGDLHDHRSNFNKIVHAANLGEHPDRHLILHELIHGDHYDAAGAEDSWQTLYRAAVLKLDFPDQVHFLLANHDLAQIHGEGISKGGCSVCEAFNKAIKRDFGPDAGRVQVAVTEFLLSFPLAARVADRLFFAHSLPNEDQIDTFDYTVFDRDLAGPDYAKRTGPVYQLIWGRRTGPAGVERFLSRVGAQLLITGHQPQEMGFATNGDRHLIIASDHNHGVFLPLDLSASYTIDQLVERLVKCAEVDLETPFD
ncbi:MAG: metallophosphoesterase [Tepidisphaerales bacterium]